MALDFPSAQLPALTPLDGSFSVDSVESELKQLFLSLFAENLSGDSFDANVLGMAHLGSFELVRKFVNTDGLVLLQGDREETTTRYLYRAWKSGNVQGRGIHFLRTYLQMLFPNVCDVEQLWHDKAYPYPTALYSSTPSFAWWLHQVGEDGLKLDGSWGIGRRIEGADETRASKKVNTDGMFLTSRILISLDFSVSAQTVSSLTSIIRSVIPARLLPIFRLWLRIVFFLSTAIDFALSGELRWNIRHPWGGRVISTADDSRWKLGIDGEPATLPRAFGSFNVGRLYGRKVGWRLKNLRAAGKLSSEITGSAFAWRPETLPTDPVPEYLPADPAPVLFRRTRRIDGSWTVGVANHVGRFRLDGRRLQTRKMTACQRFGDFKLHESKPPVLLPSPPSRLTLSGNWRLGGPRNPSFVFEIIKE